MCTFASKMGQKISALFYEKEAALHYETPLVGQHI